MRMNTTSRIARIAAKPVAALALVIGTLCLLEWYKPRSMQAFCAGVSADDSPAQVVARARERGFPVLDLSASQGRVAVLNQRSHMWRYSCEVRFKDGKVVGKRVVTAD